MLAFDLLCCVLYTLLSYFHSPRTQVLFLGQNLRISLISEHQMLNELKQSGGVIP
jgi:hypothetical protein